MNMGYIKDINKMNKIEEDNQKDWNNPDNDPLIGQSDRFKQDFEDIDFEEIMDD